MATFRPVNTSMAPEPYNRSGEEITPTTPRPKTAPTPRDDATTPTRATFGAMASQRPLPESPFPAAMSVPEKASSEQASAHRGESQFSTKSRESEDVDMGGDSDNDEEGSDEESVNADGSRSSKKKKSQRFYCTDYPPCNLSFTRSEHLARHIRKHTGERPFQCHCSRRFSRLDNLRQHAQTVHVNEEIPNDSLAATGTRFQRQVRTDRVRPPGSRARASTAGSQTPQRGHHRNSLSASSISSVGSVYSQREDARRRPPPLIMAGEHRARLSQEMYRPDSPTQYSQYRPASPGGFSTPTSATVSTGQNSPRWGAPIHSPPPAHSRTQSLYADHRTSGRRLSVPSAGNPFQSPHGGSYGPPVLGALNTSNSGTYSPSNSSMLSSPTTSTTGSVWSRRDSMSNASDEAWRRRTWHPESYSHFTSRLQNVTTPNYYSSGPPPQPTNVLPSNAPPLKLPGIESFDPLPPRAEMTRPASPPRRAPSPMMIDTPTRAAMPPARSMYEHDRAPMPQVYPEERMLHSQLDPNLQRNLGRLEIAPAADTAGSWASEANRAVQAKAEQSRTQPSVRFAQSAYPPRAGPSGSYHHSAPPITPRESKRQGWYHGPISHQTHDLRHQRTSPEDSSSSEGVPGTPSSIPASEYNPAIVHANGRVEPTGPAQEAWLAQKAHNGYTSYPAQPAGTYTYGPSRNNGQPIQQGPSQISKQQPDSNMLRLEALVAVATSEENVAATAY
ncbi:C2H2 and C2HC zinc finger-2 [Coleophoma crateriformis]|uniref:C2H2 and C2HC zinc finger-2 n=1 Tax=Coleophoma crateriformis TaxID=565419 RepID=A0A3D8RI25_9HELO|nr:C2H2 and C2HC zinc finger-2 [Coleophoma crateriformis]